MKVGKEVQTEPVNAWATITMDKAKYIHEKVLEAKGLAYTLDFELTGKSKDGSEAQPDRPGIAGYFPTMDAFLHEIAWECEVVVEVLQNICRRVLDGTNL